MPLSIRKVILLTAVLAAMRANIASAELVVYEPFDYPAGTVLHGRAANGINLTGNYELTGSPAASRIVVSSPGLNYGNLVGAPTASGNRANQLNGVSAAGAKVSVDNDVLIAAGSEIYWSALFTLDDSTNGNRLASITFTNDDNGDELRFGEAGVGVRAIRVEADTAATGQTVAAGADQSFVDGQTLLLVGRYINSAAAAGDRLDLIGYDTADADVLPLSFSPSDPNAEFAYALTNLEINFEKISSLTFAIRGDGNNFIDELRIGPTYAAVIPEPAAPALLLLSGCIAGLISVCRWSSCSGRTPSEAVSRCGRTSCCARRDAAAV
jgi:hypothetical protein